MIWWVKIVCSIWRCLVSALLLKWSNACSWMYVIIYSCLSAGGADGVVGSLYWGFMESWTLWTYFRYLQTHHSNLWTTQRFWGAHTVCVIGNTAFIFTRNTAHLDRMNVFCLLLCRNWPTCMTHYIGLTLKWWKWCILGRGYLGPSSEWHFLAR